MTMPPPDTKIQRKSKPDIKKSDLDDEFSVITTNDLQSILDVNHKAIEIYIEVEKNQEEVMKMLEDSSKVEDKFIKDTSDSLEELDKKITEIEKLLFRLIIILGAIGTSTLAAALPAIIKSIAGK